MTLMRAKSMIVHFAVPKELPSRRGSLHLKVLHIASEPGSLGSIEADIHDIVPGQDHES